MTTQKLENQRIQTMENKKQNSIYHYIGISKKYFDLNLLSVDKRYDVILIERDDTQNSLVSGKKEASKEKA